MLENFFSIDYFMPHGHCYFWKPEMLWLHFTSDLLNAGGYYLVAGAIIYFTRGRKDLPSKTVTLLIGFFLVFTVCGTTHLLEGVTIWYPAYGLEGTVKAINAGISLYVFGFMLVPLIPIALDAPSPAQLVAANFALTQEISERKKVEQQLEVSLTTLQAKNQELRDNESRLTQFLEAMPIGVLVIDANASPFYANRVAQQLLGDQPAPTTTFFLQSEVSLANHGQAYPSEYHPLAQALKGETARGDNLEIHQLEKTIPIEFWATPVFDELGDITYAIMAFQDITERLARENSEKRARVLERLKHEELIQTRQELVQSEKMASLGRLVAGFAHELNTPLGVAVGCASALQREAHKIRHLMAQEEVDVDDLLEAVISIEKGFTLTLSNLERAANLVTSFKRTAVDQTSNDIRTFRVLEVIEDTINTLQSRFKKTDIKIQVACPQELKVKSFPGALEQLLTNLLMNSLIHGFEEGQRAGQIQILVQLQENHLHLEYSDNGKGIASENLAKIFEPFFTTHRAHGGSGLGMYICYNLVMTQLQGTITCDSVLGNGVKFTIIFPVSVD
jgi:signal transduction histidine kinase